MPSRLAPPLCLLAALLPLCACTPMPSGRSNEDLLRDPNTRVTRSGWQAWQERDDRNKGKSSIRRQQSGAHDLFANYGWGMSLAVFDGPNRLDLARQAVQECKLEKCLLAEHDGQVEVFIGHYEKADAQDALKDMKKWQRLETTPGTHPFASAAIRPLPCEERPLSDDPADAHRFCGYVTLLVGFYTEDFGDNWREEAKRVVKVLRKEGPDGQGGVEAFFRINEEKKEAAVLVGLFNRHDHWVRKQADGEKFFVDAPGPMVEEMQRRFPVLLHNNKKVPAGGEGAAGGFGAFEKAGLVELN